VSRREKAEERNVQLGYWDLIEKVTPRPETKRFLSISNYGVVGKFPLGESHNR